MIKVFIVVTRCTALRKCKMKMLGAEFFFFSVAATSVKCNLDDVNSFLQIPLQNGRKSRDLFFFFK